jgi:flavin reductase (DIM6/NTAB) family NADH-FMN oxidoreductase RutF
VSAEQHKGGVFGRSASEVIRARAPSPTEFRQAMASLPTAVTLVTAPGPRGPAGATANAVTSLSLDPPLMLACLDRGSRTLAAVEAAGRFGISVLHAGQEELARGFATKAPHPEKWAEVEWAEREGIPALADALLWVACELEDVIAGGDHVILTGTVLAFEVRDGDPLVFWGGAYRPLGA